MFPTDDATPLALTQKEIEKLEGQYDADGFYVLNEGGFIDPKGFRFDEEGYDVYGGHYDEHGYV